MPKTENKEETRGRPPKYTEPEVMQADIDAYFALCEQNKSPKTIMGLALALDMCRDTLCEYAKQGAFSDIVKRAKDIVVAEVEAKLLNGSGNVAGPIFWLKNHGGMNDKQQLEHTGKDGEPIEFTDIERAKRLEFLLNRGRARRDGQSTE
jgi:hypothetical protein